MHKNRCRLGEAYSAPPDPLTGFKGPTSKGKGEGLGRGRGGGGEGWGRGWERGGGVGETNRPPHDKILATPLHVHDNLISGHLG